MRKPQADILNDLLQGELAAVETYTQAMDKVDSNHGGPELKQIRAEHHNAANILLQQITKLGAEPETNSGAWGLLAKAVEGAAKILGPAAALKALKEGEESGVRMYERALQENRLSDGFHEMIQYRLLPQTQAHIPVIDRLISMQS
jgi:uncharacterized membrane protein YccC